MSIGKQIREFLKVSEVFLRHPDVDGTYDEWSSLEGAGNALGHLCMPYALHALKSIAWDGYGVSSADETLAYARDGARA